MTHVDETSGTIPAGRIEVLPQAIAAIAARAAAETEGVVGLALPNAPTHDGGLRPGQERRGIEIRLRDDQLAIDVYVLVQYGAHIAGVSDAVQQRVRAAVEQALGQPPDQVHVRVQGLRGRL